MNPSPDSPPENRSQPPGPEKSATPTTPNWRKALMTLISSRADLVSLELKKATRENGKRAGKFAGAAFFLLFAWGFLLAGGTVAISETFGWGWCWIALATGGIHLVAGLALVISAKKPGPPLLPITRAEFHKDRKWIETLHTQPKSTD